MESISYVGAIVARGVVLAGGENPKKVRATKR
jgi:hypothetical protein